MPLTRRALLALATYPFLLRPALSVGLVATVTKVSGPASARLPDGSELGLTVGLGLPAGTSLATGGALLELALVDGTRLNMGRNTSVALATDRTTGRTAASESSLSISGIAVLDRRGADGAASLTVTSDGFEVLLADSRVFIDSLVRPAVLAQTGTAKVGIGSDQIVLASGEGIDLPLTDATVPARWAPSRVAEAFAAVGLNV